MTERSVDHNGHHILRIFRDELKHSLVELGETRERTTLRRDVRPVYNDVAGAHDSPRVKQPRRLGPWNPLPLESPAVADTTVKAVLWDFGGVLTTSPFDAFAAYEESIGIPAGAIRQLNATNPHTNAWARFERGELDVEAFAVEFEAEAAAAGHELDALAVLAGLRGELRPAMVEALRRCHERLLTGLLTNNFEPASSEAQESNYASVLDMFHVVIQSSEVGHRKPDPIFYEMACDKLGIDPPEAVFLDDLGVNLKPARAMGMRTIKVVDPEAAISELEEIVGFRLG